MCNFAIQMVSNRLENPTHNTGWFCVSFALLYTIFTPWKCSNKFSLRILQCCGLVGPPGVPNEGVAQKTFQMFVYRFTVRLKDKESARHRGTGCHQFCSKSSFGKFGNYFCSSFLKSIHLVQAQCLHTFRPCRTPQNTAGRVLRPSAVVAFVARHRRLTQMRGLEVARPRVAFHWTQAGRRSCCIISIWRCQYVLAACVSGSLWPPLVPLNLPCPPKSSS